MTMSDKPNDPKRNDPSSAKPQEPVSPEKEREQSDNAAIRAAAHRGQTPVQLPEGGRDRDAQHAVPSPFGTSVPADEPVHAPFSTPNVISVIALEKGHDGFTLREVGEVFEVDINSPKFRGSTWFEPLDKSRSTKRESEGGGFRRTPTDPRPPGQGPRPGSEARDPRDVD
jgi:hypothetical protein